MICPHCLKKIEDGSSTCPHCGTYLGSEDSPRHTEFIFCDGCGARLSPHDRTCPKCGRPAPGILSSDAAASDLAAGRTASFPRLSQRQIDADSIREIANADAILSDAADPSATTVLPALDDMAVDEPRKSAKPKRVHEDEDPYHKHKRRVPKPLVVIVVLLLVCGSVYGFVTYDPFNVMPGFYREFGAAAKDMFPTRQISEDPDGDSSASADSAADASGAASSTEDTELDGDTAYDRLSALYDEIVSYSDDSEIGEVITSFNGSYLASSHATRQENSKSAYELRDRIKKTMDDIDALSIKEGSGYVEQADHLKSLAQWMYDRVDAICSSWDVSLAVPQGESVAAHQSDILLPMQKAGDMARQQFKSHLSSYRPRKLSS